MKKGFVLIVIIIFMIVFAQEAYCQLSLTNAGTAVVVNFSTAIAGVNELNVASVINQQMMHSSPGSNMLDADAWAFAADGAVSGSAASFPGSLTANFDMTISSGNSTNGWGMANISSDRELAIFPTGSYATPGSVTLKVINKTGYALNELVISYNIRSYNDQAMASKVEFWHSPSNTENSYAIVNSATFVSTPTANLTFESASPSVSISGLNVANNSSYYLRWFFDDFSGTGSRDEFYLDDISVQGNAILPASISVSTSSLSGFSYPVGAGPSVSQSYNLSGSNLSPASGGITVAGSTNYEVSTDNSSFSSAVNVAYSGGALSSTPVYVRLKAGLSVGSYSSETISNSGGGASAQNVTCSGSVLAVSPSIQSSNISFVSGTATSFTINWNNGDGAGRITVMRAGGAVNSDPTDGTTYTPNIIFSSGSEIGTGNYVVYNSTGNSVTVTGLTPGTTYYVSVYEYNGTGSTINYLNASPATGSYAVENAIYLDGSGVTTENFNSLVYSGSSSSLPVGWYLYETGTGANTAYAAGTGSGGSGETYSFGTAANNDRALGTLRDDNLISTIGAKLYNNTGITITQLPLAYVGEQWRLGAIGRTDRLDFQYSINATSLSDGTWTDFNALDFSAPISTGTTGQLDGNSSANRVSISGTITGLNVLNGNSIWIRWTDPDVAGSEDGLAIDDFSLNESALPVELTYFSARLINGEAALIWRTATEVDNYGFEIERSKDRVAWEKLAFVPGSGNSNSEKEYCYTDKTASSGKFYYRLKQVDTDGSYEYSAVVSVDLGMIPGGFILSQNYPNPFNPSTSIRFAFNEDTKASVIVYNILGDEIREVFNNTAEAGRIYEINFDATGLTSGIYYYKLISSAGSDVKKMLLVR